MSDNKLVKTLTDAATVTGLAAGIGFLAKKVINESMTSVVGKWGFWLIDLGNFQNLDNFHF